MLVPLSILPIYLLLVHGVTSSYVRNLKRVPRRHTQVTRTYVYNHPPMDNDDDPLNVAYDYQEERNEKVRKADLTERDEKNLKHVNNAKSVYLGAQNVGHPPFRSLFAGVDDYKIDLNLKPSGRSINITEINTNETISATGSATQTSIKRRRRVQKVRKVKVTNSQLNINSDNVVRELNITGNKTVQKDTATTTPQTNATKPSHHIHHTFSRRNGTRDPVVPIIESENYVFSHSGDFHYSYEGGDGTKAYERGELKSINGSSGSAVEGHFSYKDKDGKDISLSYTADENGYRPIGAHLPTPPPIPIAIQRALAYLATKTTPEPITERTKRQ